MSTTAEYEAQMEAAEKAAAHRKRVGPRVTNGHNPNFVRSRPRKKERTTNRGFMGKAIRAVFIDDEKDPDGLGKIRYLHATKGWKTRLATPAFMQQVMGR